MKRTFILNDSELRNPRRGSGNSRLATAAAFCLCLLLACVCGTGSLSAQTALPFTQRTSVYSPDQTIYHIQGDYTIIGNTNVTLSNYCDLCNNGNNSEKYVIVDTPNTTNSSTAELTFSEEYGANPSCSNIVFAGLYWCGRSSDNVRLSTTNTYYNNSSLAGAYNMTITTTGSGQNNVTTYTLTPTSGGDTVVYKFSGAKGNRGQNNCALSVSIGGSEFVTKAATFNTSSGTATATLTSPLKWVDANGTAHFLTTLYKTTRSNSNINSDFHVSGGTGTSKFTVRMKHESEENYTTVTTHTETDIYYPDDDYKDIYASYAEVTDYVRAHGMGKYTVADICTYDRISDGTGTFGCWALVVVYENSRMKWRDITIFDGYTMVQRGHTPVDLSISGFKTVQVGHVNMKLGILAAEGDADVYSGDMYIQKLNTSEWQNIRHGHFTNQGGFFNSSIEPDNYFRNPHLVNNTGIDIIMMDIPNENNSLIGNEQESTTFRFTSDGDLYVPFCLVMGVDAYIPDAEGLSGVANLPADSYDAELDAYVINPGDSVKFTIDVKNFGTEDIINAKLEIPLPVTIDYYTMGVDYTYPGVTVGQYVDLERNANGTVGWTFNHIPSGDPNQVYAKLYLTSTATENCWVLASTDDDCLLEIVVNGTLEGTSEINNVHFKKEALIRSYTSSGPCQGEADRKSLRVILDRKSYLEAGNCQDQDYTMRNLNICTGNYTTGAVPYSTIASLYPLGSRFSWGMTEYNINTGFPIPDAFDKTIVVDLPTTEENGCSSKLQLHSLTSDLYPEPTIDPSIFNYCQNAVAEPLSTAVTLNGTGLYARYYRTNDGTSPAEADITPSTATPGTQTYYVRQFREESMGCEDNTYYPITVTVEAPVTISTSHESPSCVGEEVVLTGNPAGGTWGYDSALASYISVSGNTLTILNTIPAGRVTVTYTNAAAAAAAASTCPDAATQTYTHEINKTTIAGTLSENQTICTGSQIYPLQITGHNSHISKWESSSDGSIWTTIANNTATLSSAQLNELTAGTYYFRAYVQNGNCAEVTTNTVTVTVLSDAAPDAPVLDNPQYACYDEDYTITVPTETADYQWYESESGGIDNPSLQTVHVGYAWTTRYVSVRDNAGCESARSIVTVRPNLSIGGIGTGGQTECSTGATAATIRPDQATTLPSGITGTISYQWYVSEDGGTTYTPISGATSSEYTPTAYMNREGTFMFVRYDKFSGCANAMKAVGIYTLTIGSPNTAISAEPSDGIICSDNSATLTLSAAGPSTKYKYQWYKDGIAISGAINQTCQTTEAGKYTVKVTHRATGCEATTPDADAVIATTDNQAPTIATIASQSAMAAGNCTFKVPDLTKITLDNSNDDHSDVIFVSQIPDTSTTITADTVVTVTVKDACGNEASQAVNVTIPAALTVTTTVVDDIDCIGQTATVSVIATGGTGSYSYRIDDNDWQTSDTFSVAKGSHTFVAKDGNGCTATSTRVIDAPAVDLTVSVRVDNETCAGNDGAVTLTVSGGTPGYTYQWKKNGTDYATTQDLSNVEADTYTVVVTDSKGCPSDSVTATVGLTNNLTVTYPTDAALCSGTELNIVPTASHTVTYTWNAPTATGITGAVAGNNATSILGGTLLNNTTEAQTITYQVTATTTNGKCTLSEKDVPVTVYAPVSGGTIDGATITCSYRDNDGTLHYINVPELISTQAAAGGAPNGTYSWTMNSNTIENANNETYIPSSLSDGTYSFTRIYNNVCGNQSSNTVEVVYAGTITPGSICQTAEACDVQLCSNGTLGGTLTANPIVSAAVGDGYSINWKFRISDDNGATWTSWADMTSEYGTVTGSNNITLTLPSTMTNTGNMNKLVEYQYTLTVTGCVSGLPSNDHVTVTVYPTPEINVTDAASQCYNTADGYIEYSIAGGTPDYQVTIVDTSTTNTHTAAGTYRFENLADGTYTISAEDGHNCAATTGTGGTAATIQQIETPLTITSNSNTWNYDGLTHSDGGYTVTFGTETYTVDAGGSATLVNGDVVTATISGTQTEKGSSDNTVASYTVTRDGDDITCYYNTVATKGTLTVNPRAITLTAGSVTTEYDGYEHSWSEAVPTYTISAGTLASGDSISDITITGARTIEGETPTVITPNSVVIKRGTDNVTANYTITLVPGKLTINHAAQPVIVTITGHKGEFCYDTYSHTVHGYDVAINDPLNLYTKSDFNFSGDSTITKSFVGEYGMNLQPGQFTNDNPNFGTVTFNVTDGSMKIWNTLTITNANVTDVTCNGAGNGLATITVTGGKEDMNPRYTYTLDDSAAAGSNSPIELSALTPGTHTIAVSDALGCTASQDFTVSQPDVLAATLTTPEDLCPNRSSYAVSVNATGGNGGYHYAWSGDAAAIDAAATTVNKQGANDCGHTYSVTAKVTDSKGCTVTESATFTVTDTEAPDFTVPANVRICHTESSDPAHTGKPTNLTDNCTAADGLSVTHTDSEDISATSVSTITRKWIVTDLCGNETRKEQTIQIMPKVVMDAVSDQTLCVGESSAAVHFTSSITDGTVTYAWTNSDTRTGLAANGNGDIASFTAANPTLSDLSATVTVTPTYTYGGTSCTGDSRSFGITVRPSILTPGAFELDCPADITLTLDYGECGRHIDIGTPDTESHMSGMTVVISNDAPADGIFPEGTTTVTWKATDECGASLTCTQLVTVSYPPCGTPADSVADANGYKYSSVRIGCNCWTGENLRTTTYMDPATCTAGAPVASYRSYMDSDSLEAIYGKLYTWHSAVNVPEGDDSATPATQTTAGGATYVQGICPCGWAMPTPEEYLDMLMHSGGAVHAKEADSRYWLPGTEGQAPLSGFDARGAGYWDASTERYLNLMGQTDFWTATSGDNAATAKSVEINYYCEDGIVKDLDKGLGLSIRCIRKK